MKSQTVSPSRDSPSGLHTEFVSGKGRPASVQVSPPSEVTYTGALSNSSAAMTACSPSGKAALKGFQASSGREETSSQVLPPSWV